MRAGEAVSGAARIRERTSAVARARTGSERMIESSPRKRAWRRTSRRVHWLALGLSACVGGISDPDRFGDGTSCPSDLRIEELFEVSCAGGACHGADASPAGGLDLVTPGFAERMIGVPSEICGWMDLVVPGDAE